MSKFQYFTQVKDLTDLRNQYRELAKAWHPDKHQGQDTTDIMQTINQEYEKLFTVLVHQQGWKADRVDREIKIDPELRAVLDKIIALESITIEICGNWIWVGGDTRQYKSYFKECGLRWAPKKLMWYFRPEDYKRIWFNKEYTMDEIRDYYGTSKVEPEGQAKRLHN